MQEGSGATPIQIEEARQALKSATDKIRGFDDQIKTLSQEIERAKTDWRSVSETLHQEKQKIDSEIRRLEIEEAQKIRQLEVQYAESMSRLEQQFSARKLQLEQDTNGLKSKITEQEQRQQTLVQQRRDADRQRTEAMQKVPHTL